MAGKRDAAAASASRFAGETGGSFEGEGNGIREGEGTGIRDGEAGGGGDGDGGPAAATVARRRSPEDGRRFCIGFCGVNFATAPVSSAARFAAASAACAASAASS